MFNVDFQVNQNIKTCVIDRPQLDKGRESRGISTGAVGTPTEAVDGPVKAVGFPRPAAPDSLSFRCFNTDWLLHLRLSWLIIVIKRCFDG